MGFVSVLKKIAPTLGLVAETAATTLCPAAAPIIKIAAGVVSKGTGKTVASTGQAITDALTGLLATPEQQLQLKQMDQEFAEQMKNFDIQSADDMEKFLSDLQAADAADRASARDLDAKTQSKTPSVAFWIINIGFFGILVSLVIMAARRITMEQGIFGVLSLLLGSLREEFRAVYAYWVGVAPASNGNGGSH